MARYTTEQILAKNLDFKILKIGRTIWYEFDDNGNCIATSNSTNLDSVTKMDELIRDTNIFLSNPIQKIKRISDNRVVQIGDDILHPKYPGKIYAINLTSDYRIVLKNEKGYGYYLSEVEIDPKTIEILKSKIVVTTEDSKDLRHGDIVWIVDSRFGYKSLELFYNSIITTKSHKYFSTEELAAEYVIMNTPKLSIKDFINFKDMSNKEELAKSLVKLVKERL